MNKKNGIIAAIILLGTILIVFYVHQQNISHSPKKVNQEQPTKQQTNEINQVELISTTPPNLDSSTISPSQTIEFTFNYAIDETNQKFQFNLDPAIDLKVETSDDHKTLKMTAIKGFGFDQGYTLQIKSGNAFSGGKKLDNDINMHFTTTSYSGI